MMQAFASLYSHGFVRIASCVPRTKVADVPANLAETIRLAEVGGRGSAAIMVFPELGLSSYAIDDLLFQDALLASVEAAIDELLNALLKWAFDRLNRLSPASEAGIVRAVPRPAP